RRRMLIDSMLRGIKLPKFYFAEIDGVLQFNVVDGQQRLATIRDFKENKFALSPITIRDFNLTSGYYKDLPPELRAQFDTFALQIDEMRDASPEDVRKY